MVPFAPLTERRCGGLLARGQGPRRLPGPPLPRGKASGIRRRLAA